MGCHDIFDAFDWSVFALIWRNNLINNWTTFLPYFGSSIWASWNKYKQLANIESVAVAEKIAILSIGKLSKIETANDFQILSVLGAYFLPVQNI